MLKVRIEKNHTLRTGNWERWPLDAAQQQYAALDAYAALLLYKASSPSLTRKIAAVMSAVSLHDANPMWQ